MSYWVPGTSTMDIDGTRTLPALWDNIPDAIAKGQQLSAAADAMAAVAGDGLEAVQANVGPIFQAHGGQRLLHPGVALGRCQARQDQRQLDVAAGAVGVEAVP